MPPKNGEQEKLEPKKSEELLKILEKLEKNTARISEQERESFFKKALEWETANDIGSIRQAGITKERNEKDPLQKHALLSSAYLAKVGDGRYKVDFKGNNLAEYKVGAGDIFPPNIGIVAVNGTIAVRTINPETGRIGYYSKNELEQYKTYEYVPIFSGDVVEVIEAKPYEDPVVQRRQFQENISLYQGKAATAMEVQEMREEDVRKNTKQKLRSLREEVQPIETNEAMRKLVEVAKTYLDDDKGKMFHEKFYSKESKYKGGRLGCAITTTWMAREAGVINFTNPGVMNTKGKFHEQGWGAEKYIPGKERPGQIITWKRKSGGNHIGIIVGPNQVIHNVFDQKTQRARPKLTSIKGYGPTVRTITLWTPPGKEQSIQAERRVTEQPKSTQRLQSSKGRPLPQKETKIFSSTSIESRVGKYNHIIYEAAKRFNVPANLIKAVIMQESGGRPELASHAGAGGLMQLMPGTAKAYGVGPIYPTIPTGKRWPTHQLDPRDGRLDPQKCIMAGAKILRDMLKRYNGDAQKALAAYNWGPGNLDKYVKGSKNMPNETRNYYPNILAMKASLDKADPKHS